MNPLARDVIRAELQVRTASELRNPLLKMALIIIPLLLVISEGTTRLGGHILLNSCQLVLAVYVLTTAAGVDTRAGKVHLFVRKAIFFGALAVLFLLGATGYLDLVKDLMGTLASMYRNIPFLRVIGIRTWLIVGLIFSSLVAVSNLSTRDGLWLGRRALAGIRFRLYMIVMVTLAVLMSSLTVRLEDCWRIGFARYHLSKNRGYGHLPWRSRVTVGFRAFLKSLFFYVDHTADVVRSLAEDRGFFEDDYRDPHFLHGGSADLIAVVVIVGGVVGILAASSCLI